MAQQKVQTMDKKIQTIDIGIDANTRKAIVEKLSRLLADSYTLYLKTHNFHWNVTGPMFRDLHLLFEEHYNELASAVDVIAERVRTLGAPAPGTYREFSKLTRIKEPDGVPAAVEMIAELTADHEGQTVILNGWVDTRRDHGGLVFIDLRDRYGLTQVVFEADGDAALFAAAQELRGEWVVSVRGKVRERLPNKHNSAWSSLSSAFVACQATWR